MKTKLNKKLQFLILFLTVSCSLFQPSYTPTSHQMIEGKASYVIDGKTFYFSFDKGKFKVLLNQANAPSLSEKNGKQAFDFLHGLINQKNIKIEYLETDSEGRWVVNANLETGENIQEKVNQNAYGSVE